MEHAFGKFLEKVISGQNSYKERFDFALAVKSVLRDHKLMEHVDTLLRDAEFKKFQNELAERKREALALQDRENKLFHSLEADIVDVKRNAQWATAFLDSIPSDVRQRFAFRKKSGSCSESREDCMVRCLYMVKFQQGDHKLAQDYLAVRLRTLELDQAGCAAQYCTEQRESNKSNVLFCRRHRILLCGSWKSSHRVRWWYHHHPALLAVDQKQQHKNTAVGVRPTALGQCAFCKIQLSFYQASPTLAQAAEDGGLPDINNARPACSYCVR